MWKLKNGKTVDQMTIFNADKTNTIYYGVVDGYVYKWDIDGFCKLFMEPTPEFDLIMERKIDRSGNLF
jgi:hypothetical protein